VARERRRARRFRGPDGPGCTATSNVDTSLVRRKRIDEIKSLAGKITLDIDIDRSRRRPREQPPSRRR